MRPARVSSETILVTGGTGFIGRCLVKRLLGDGHRVRVLCLPSDPGAGQLTEDGADVVRGDVTDPASVLNAADGVDRIYHCAAVVTDWAPRAAFDRVNIDGMANVLRAAAKNAVKRFVWISTNDVFGVVEDHVVTEDDEYRRWGELYPDTKIAAERLAWEAYRRLDLPATTVYPCWVYGPGDCTFVPLLIDAIRSGEMLFWRRDAIMWPAYVENVADLMVRVGWDGAAIGQGYLVHDGMSVTVQEFCRRLAERSGHRPAGLHVPYGAVYGAAALMQFVWWVLRIRSRPLLTTYAIRNLGSRLRYSIDKAQRELGWTPPVSFEDGFAETMAWIESAGAEALLAEKAPHD